MPLSYQLLPVRAFQDLFSMEHLEEIASLEWSILLDSFHAVQVKRAGDPDARLAQYYLDMASEAHIQRWGHLGDEFLSHMRPFEEPK